MISTAQLMSEVVKINSLQRLGIAAGSAFGAFFDPYRDDLVAALWEVCGTSGLRNLRRRVVSVPEGRQVMTERPFISSETISLPNLRELPNNTFGYHYVAWLDRHKVTPDSRKPVRFLEDPELAYLVLRIRQAHDFFHVLLNMPIQVSGELAVKLFEAHQFRLPGPVLAGVFGPFSIICNRIEMDRFLNLYLPVALQNMAPNQNAHLMLSAYFEKRFEQDISDLRKEFNIIPFVKP